MNVSRKVFGCWVFPVEGSDIIDMMVIEAINHGLGNCFQLFKVEADADLVYFICLDFDTDFPRVAVEGSTGSLITVKLM